MATTTQETAEELKSMLAAQLEIEHRWYGIKHTISDTDLKDPIAVALPSARDRLQTLVDSLQG